MTGDILPNWEQWAESGPALLSFRITKVLTGHGCFREYLKRIGAEATAACHHCNADLDSAQHTLEVCEAFEEQRRVLTAVIGSDLSPAAIISALLAGDEKERRLPPFAAEREWERLVPGRRRGMRRRPPAVQRQDSMC